MQTMTRKQELRKVSYTMKEAKRKLNRSNDSIPVDWSLDKVIKHDFAFDTVREQADGSWAITDDYTKQTVIISHNGEQFILHNDVILSDGTCTTEEDALKEIGDLTNEQQKEFLENFDLTQIEKYMSKRTGINVKFNREIKYNERAEQYEMRISTDNIVEHAGVCKAMLKELYLDTFGTINFSIDRETGEQFLWIPALHFSYSHVSGGSNGAEAGRVRYIMQTGEIQGYNYETEEFEAI